MEPKQKVKKTVKTLFMSCPAFPFHIINLTVWYLILATQ